VTAVGDGCYAWIQPNGEWFESNAGLVTGDGESALIDTLADLKLTRRMLDAFNDITAHAPIRTLVNTHSDGDHVNGNQLVADADIVSSRRSAELIRHQDPGSFKGFGRLARGMRLVGGLPVPVVGSLSLPVLPRLRLRPIGAYIGDMLEPFDFDGIDVAAPTREFEGEMSLDAGGRKLRLLEVGPAHTPGDLFIHVPDAGVVYTGDILFVGATPVMWAGPVINWIVAIERLLDLDADTYVPGHGPVCGRPEAEAVKRYWVWLEAAARHRFGLGMSAWEAARDIALSPEFKTYEWAEWGQPERIVVNVHTLERERRGQLGGELSPRELVTIFARVALLARDLEAS
jgi:glyoxylase-like metal-dependent hydrolase (beta-lactamase superfamily II)